MIGRIRRLITDRRGAALIEFAILMPVMLLIFVGGYQLSDAVACKRRVGVVARAVADMVSQSATVSAADVDAILDASTQILFPYALDNATVRVSQVSTDPLGGNPRVVWSRGENIAALPVGTSLPVLPAGMRQPASFYIYSEVTYAYAPLVANILPNISFTQTLFMLPRKSASVDLKS